MEEPIIQDINHIDNTVGFVDGITITEDTGALDEKICSKLELMQDLGKFQSDGNSAEETSPFRKRNAPARSARQLELSVPIEQTQMPFKRNSRAESTSSFSGTSCYTFDIPNTKSCSASKQLRFTKADPNFSKSYGTVSSNVELNFSSDYTDKPTSKEEIDRYSCDTEFLNSMCRNRSKHAQLSQHNYIEQKATHSVKFPERNSSLNRNIRRDGAPRNEIGSKIFGNEYASMNRTYSRRPAQSLNRYARVISVVENVEMVSKHRKSTALSKLDELLASTQWEEFNQEHIAQESTELMVSAIEEYDENDREISLSESKLEGVDLEKEYEKIPRKVAPIIDSISQKSTVKRAYNLADLLSVTIPQHTLVSDRWVYHIVIKLKNENQMLLYRHYNDFWALLVTLISHYPSEAGYQGHPRIIPFLPPASKLTESQAKSFRSYLEKYLNSVLMLPDYILQENNIDSFFQPRNNDIMNYEFVQVEDASDLLLGMIDNLNNSRSVVINLTTTGQTFTVNADLSFQELVFKVKSISGMEFDSIYFQDECGIEVKLHGDYDVALLLRLDAVTLSV
jgi:hypothetical protein